MPQLQSTGRDEYEAVRQQIAALEARKAELERLLAAGQGKNNKTGRRQASYSAWLPFAK